MKKKSKKDQKDQNKKIFSTVMLAIYVVIFITFIIIIRLNNGKTVKKEEQQYDGYKINSVEDVDKSLKEENYAYEYTLTINNIKYLYKGIRYNEKESFIYKSGVEQKKYYRYGELFLLEENSKYILSENPYYYFNFYDQEIIRNIISKSSKNEQGIYEITTTELAKIINPDKKIENNSINTLIVKYTNKNICEVTIDFTNYAQEIGIMNSLVLVNMIYYDFNNIQEFNIGGV